jgi:hypothetical protein
MMGAIIVYNRNGYPTGPAPSELPPCCLEVIVACNCSIVQAIVNVPANTSVFAIPPVFASRNPNDFLIWTANSSGEGPTPWQPLLPRNNPVYDSAGVVIDTVEFNFDGYNFIISGNNIELSFNPLALFNWFWIRSIA